MQKRNVIVVLGMMRSGTSFLANWLVNAGFNLGETYINPDKIWNENGFFEDKELRKINELIKTRNDGVLNRILLMDFVKPELIQDDFKRARKLIERKVDCIQWGWKAPFTCMVWNDLWYPLLNQFYPKKDIFLIITYRHYSEVIESLVRVNSLSKNFLVKIHFRCFKNYYANKFLDMWLLYNKEILYFIDNNPDFKNYCVLDNNNLVKNSATFFDFLVSKFDLKLQLPNIMEIYKPDLMGRKSKIGYSLKASKIKEAEIVFKRLECISMFTNN